MMLVDWELQPIGARTMWYVQRPITVQNLPGRMGPPGYNRPYCPAGFPGDLGAASHGRYAAVAQDLPGMMGSVGHDCRDCAVRAVH